jgi:hypothetical protein
MVNAWRIFLQKVEGDWSGLQQERRIRTEELTVRDNSRYPDISISGAVAKYCPSSKYVARTP